MQIPPQYFDAVCALSQVEPNEPWQSHGSGFFSAALHIAWFLPGKRRIVFGHRIEVLYGEYGRVVIIRSENNRCIYAHLGKADVANGANIAAGQTIGQVGRLSPRRLGASLLHGISIDQFLRAQARVRRKMGYPEKPVIRNGVEIMMQVHKESD